MKHLMIPLLTIILLIPSAAQQNPYRVTDLNPSTNINLGYPMTREVLDGYLYFCLDDGTGVHLWRTNGTVTEKIHDVAPRHSMTAIGNLVFFTGEDSNGEEPWRTDGTSSGTFMLKDVVRSGLVVTNDIAGNCFTEMGRDVYFISGYWDFKIGRSKDYLLKTDGTVRGTKSVASGPGYISLANIGSDLVIDAIDLWKYDGKRMTELMDICSSWPGGSNCRIVPYPDFDKVGTYAGFRHPLVVNGVCYNTLLDEDNGNELWRSDGTVTGTYQLTDINPGSGSSSPSHIVRMGDYLYFAAYDDAHGMELWRYPLNGNGFSDAVLVADINPGPGHSEPIWLTTVGNAVYFSAYEPETGRELWIYDGTSARRVKDINPGGGSSDPHFTKSYEPRNLKYARFFTAIDGIVYFSADDGVNGHELWRSDGTEAGTGLVADINTSPAEGSLPRHLTELDGKLFFMAFTPQDGNEWWIYDPAASVPKRGIACLPEGIGLDQNYPNPFFAGGGTAYGGSASTIIRYHLPHETEISLRVYDVFGREVARLESGVHAAGTYEARFDATGLASGFYFCRLDAEGKSIVRRMILAK